MWRYIGKLTPREDGHAKSGKDRSCAAICQGFTSHLVSPVAEETRTDHLLEGLKCTCLQASWFPIFTLQSCVCHWVLSLCDPMDCSLPGSSVHGILQARILEWVAMPSSRGSFQTRDQTHVSCVSWIAGRFFITEPSRKPYIYHTYILKEKEIEWDTWGSIVDRMVLGLILPSFFFTFSKFSEKKKKSNAFVKEVFQQTFLRNILTNIYAKVIVPKCWNA